MRDTIVITGASGNLGSKLAVHLLSQIQNAKAARAAAAAVAERKQTASDFDMNHGTSSRTTRNLQNNVTAAAAAAAAVAAQQDNVLSAAWYQAASHAGVNAPPPLQQTHISKVNSAGTDNNNDNNADAISQTKLDLQDVRKIVLIDLEPPVHLVQEFPHTAECLKVNLCADPAAWEQVLQSAFVVIHFAAQNPFPEASWEDAARSMDMTSNVMLTAARHAVPRFVFASSNHVLGGYKDLTIRRTKLLGTVNTNCSGWAVRLKSTTPLQVGTKTDIKGGQKMDSTPYASAKVAGERLSLALTRRRDVCTVFVCIRIGWCQPGENSPATISSTGTLTVEGDDQQDERQLQQHEGGAPQPRASSGNEENSHDGGDDIRGNMQTKEDIDVETGNMKRRTATLREKRKRDQVWFANMWLSNHDFCELFSRAAVGATLRPQKHIIVNGVSANTGSSWDTEEAAQMLGWRPRDDVHIAQHHRL